MKRKRKQRKSFTANIKIFEADKFEILLEKPNLRTFIFIMSCVWKLISNMRRTKVKGPLKTTNQPTDALDQKRAITLQE